MNNYSPRRNLFDQYSQPENRLTHALVCSLSEDQGLLRRFIKWATGAAQSGNIEIFEQKVPWGPTHTEDEASKKGLPDAWISSDEGWALILENKVQAPVSADQLRRHRTTAALRGWDDVHLLVLDAKAPRRRTSGGIEYKRWADLYAWICKESFRSEWAHRLKDYMEVLEGQIVEEKYFREGALTMFSGIPFNETNTWNYVEAKRLLKLAMEELRTRKKLETQLNVNFEDRGRKAITGKERTDVWDYLPIRHSKTNQKFTAYPHLTLGIDAARAQAIVIVPNGISPALRRSIIGLGPDGYKMIIGHVYAGLARILRKDEGAVPCITMAQRRYSSRSATPIIDATLEFDLRTFFGDKSRHKPVGLQTQWLDATFDSLKNRHSNLQLAIGMAFHYSRSCSVSSHVLLDRVVDAWIACKPLLKAMGAL